MLTDSEGNAPKWWEWLVSGALLVVGAVLSATGVGTALGVSLMVAGGSMMASNIMSAAGVDSKLATYISAGLNIIAGAVLCLTPFAAIGASMIGSGVGSVAGGHISEAIGFSFEVGAMIGGIVGGIAGGHVYKGISSAVGAAPAGAASTNKTAGMTAHQKGVIGEQYISKITGLSKNTRNYNGRIPDFMGKGMLIESKNVAYQGLTRQLTGYMSLARQQGLQMQLYVRQTTILSKSLKASGIIIKYFPW